MSGTLYVVATPIGNLQDITPRAAATFGSVDFIAAEDTRVTLKLLNYLGIKKPLISYFEHNAAERGALVLQRIMAGENCAVCSDAGMPCISDPGEALVREAHALGIPVVPVPAASAAATALAVSGQSTGRWCFEGFLPVNRNQRREHLDAVKNEVRTMIFYEAPHKLNNTLADLCTVFGEQRSVTICRELTKLHEEIRKTTLGEAKSYYAENSPRGEFCLVVAGGEPVSGDAPQMTLEGALAKAQQLMKGGLSPSAACKQAAREAGFAKGDVYDAYLAARVSEEQE